MGLSFAKPPKSGTKYFKYWNEFPRDIKKLVLTKLDYLEMWECRFVSKAWKTMIDEIMNHISSARIYENYLTFEITNDESSPDKLQEYYWVIDVKPTEKLKQFCKKHTKPKINYKFKYWKFLTTTLSPPPPPSQQQQQQSDSGKITDNLLERFKKRFIRERVSLFNSIFDTNLDLNFPVFSDESIRDIRVSENEFSSFAIKSFIQYSNSWSSGVSEFYMRNGCNNDSGWIGIGDEWCEKECKDILLNWTNRCENRLECFEDLYGDSLTDEEMEMQMEMEKEMPWKLLTDEALDKFNNHQWIDHQDAAIYHEKSEDTSTHIFEYVIYKTQEFLDKHNLNWKTFSYLFVQFNKISLHSFSHHSSPIPIHPLSLLQPFLI